MNQSRHHGGNIYKMAQQLLCEPKDIIDFSSNINPTLPSIELHIEPKALQVYGDPHYDGLREAISSKYQVRRAEIKLFNGASSAIFSLFEQLTFDSVALYAPLYGEYKEAAVTYGKKIQLINRLDDVWEKPKEGSLVVFVNPSTPDGRLYDFKALLDEWQALNCQVLMDESFLEFTQQASLREKVKSYKNLYIIQSFTKFYACAGLRVGAVFSHKSNIDKLFTPMWPVSTLDASLLKRLLANKEHAIESKKNFSKYSQRLRSILCEALVFDEVYPSQANYILTQSTGANEIEKRLLEHKIMVRNCENFDFLDERYLRFAVKDDKALDALEKAFKEMHE